VLGPSNVRDAIGLVPDSYANPISYVKPVRARYILYGAYLIDRRALVAGRHRSDRPRRRWTVTSSRAMRIFRTAPAWNTRAIRRLRPEQDDSGETGPGADGAKTKAGPNRRPRISAKVAELPTAVWAKARCVGRNWRG